MNELPRLSAHSLREYDRCPRAFALQYRSNSFWPAPEPQSRHQELGQVFHMLVHQRQLGLAVALDNFEKRLPELPPLWHRFEGFRYADQASFSEQTLYFQLEEARFSVRFDRLVQDGEDWLILDWKTGKIDPQKIREDWQSKLYPFALAEAGEALSGKKIDPDRIRLVYWEGATGKEHPFPYSHQRHAALREELLKKAKQLLVPWEGNEENFPRTNRCKGCRFDSFCNRPDTGVQVTEELPLPRFTLR